MTQEIYGRAASDPAIGAGRFVHGGPQDRSDLSYQTEAEDSELGGILRWSGGLMSLALVAGMGVWGWQLATRDVHEVPVVLALEGPMRVMPDSPGGAAIPHQGLAVNAVQEARGSTPVPDQLRVLQEPVSLVTEDMVVAAAPAEDIPPPRGLAEQNLARIDRLVAQAVEGAAPLGAAVPDPAPQPETASRLAEAQPKPAPQPALAAQPAQVEIVAGGMGRSLRPPQRPSFTAPRPMLASVTPTSLPAPVAVTEGSRLVQLGAFDTRERAEAAWAQLRAGEFSALFDGKAQVVQEAVSGGRTFYRLRAAGFADLDDARRFCAALKSGRADCIPVRAR